MPYELIFALGFGLLAVLGVTLSGWKPSGISSKGIIFILAGVAGAVGLAVIKSKQVEKLKKERHELELRIKEREKELRNLGKKCDLSEQELSKALENLSNLRSAYEKAVLQIEAESKDERERIDTMSTHELFLEYGTRHGVGG
ncbi:MAG: hypothetical protein ACLFQB_08990 [Chitinispirillaceae bacterium]